MKTKVTALLAVVTLLGACGGSSSEKSDSPTTVSKTKNGVTTPCDRVTKCAVGMKGITGDTVMYYSPTPFKCGSGMAVTCNFMEVAPATWGGIVLAKLATNKLPYNAQCTVPSNGIDVACVYYKVDKPLSALTKPDLGAGPWNDAELNKSSGTYDVALPPTALTFSYTDPTAPNNMTGMNVVPSLQALVMLCNYANNTPLRTDICVPSNVRRTDFQRDWYWSSTVAATDPGQPIWAVNFGTGEIAKKPRNSALYIRPVRTFLSVFDSSIPTTLPTLPPVTTLPPTTLPPTTLAPTTLPPTTVPTCATGGACNVDDIGPGGGTIVYSNAAGFKCGPNMDKTCKYLEAAPTSWSVTPAQGCQGTGVSTTCPWQVDNLTMRPATERTLGAGAKNTAAMYAASPKGAAATVRAYNGGGKTDWFIPSYGEMNEFCKWAHFGGSGQTIGDPNALCKISFHMTTFYGKPALLTSTDSTAGNAYAYLINATSSTGPLVKEVAKTDSYMVWPIRAF